MEDSTSKESPLIGVFRPGQPVRGTQADMPGLTAAWFVCMDAPETTLPRGIGCTILRRYVFRTDRTPGFPAGTVFGELNAFMLPYLESIPGREEPEREALDLLRAEVLRAHAVLVKHKGARPPSA